MSDAERTKEMRARYITHPQRARHRLPVLAAWLRKVSEHVNGARFNLDVYASWDDREYGDPPRTVKEASACGFEGCALGWARLCPALRRLGLKGSEDGSFFHAVEEAEEVFGITYNAARVIFGESSEDWRDGGRAGYITDHRINRHDPIAAAERVERFMADMGIAALPHEPPSQTTT